MSIILRAGGNANEKSGMFKKVRKEVPGEGHAALPSFFAAYYSLVPESAKTRDASHLLKVPSLQETMDSGGQGCRSAGLDFF